MAERASVESLDAIKMFRVALIKFAEAGSVALADAESEIARTLIWLENEARSHWENQIRKRHEIVERCKEAVRMKKLFKDSTGRQQSAVDEEKALAIAKRNLDEAEQKLANVRKYTRVLQKEMQMYKGGVARLQTDVASVLPQAALELGAMIEALEAYSSLQAESPEAASAAPATGSMTRAIEDEKENESDETRMTNDESSSKSE
jgi:flavin-binding protein dodecin